MKKYFFKKKLKMAFIDIALVLSVIALIVYILIITNVIPGMVGNFDLYHLSYVLLIISILLFIIWLLIRFCECCMSYGRRNSVSNM